ncbi:angiogenic factor with G patch and FHA domains 1 isoform X2 [Phycodurus eques]|uniref:angiogenic factor with G patch and FHA domains 1 isoform X2 n=1 Tax=Phycodurus eques TaxID=693459 RepID=UPI002ACEB354|nr:angiogenic factor with G patch and FHA domains 1 isoform X2 [Phycodurus eques]
MEDEDGEKDSGCAVAELRLQVVSLKEELKECKAELAKLQKQLSHSERLQRSTESYNEDLRKQVDQLSAEIHEWKKKNKDKVHTETQTEEYVWSETDYYNYYHYADYYQNTEAADSQESLGATVAVDVTGGSDSAEAAKVEQAGTTAGTVADVSAQPDSSVVVTAEEGDAASIADMLRATAEEAMTQTGFVFDETTGMYYDQSTGFYYDSVSQLYYDANTGIYYYYDAESGRYQFHSKIEVSAVQTGDQDDCTTQKKGRWYRRGVKKTSHIDKEFTFNEVKSEEEEQQSKRTSESRKTRRRSRSSESREKDSKRRGERDKSSSKKKKHKSGSSHDEKRKSKKKKKRSKSVSRKKQRSSPTRSDDLEGNSEAEEGELSESEKEQWESPPSLSPSPSSPCNHSAESEMEAQCRAELWPPCVRVTVVRSPVLQVGTLFIITADAAATIGREKDMDHAIRIPEMGVSKFHAEVYFDQQQQSYMLVDQGSQNGTVINGNRILQPKTKCEPHPLTHGDEVKMGDTVLSFHIHAGTDTCDGCEPGQVMAHLSKHKREDTPGPTLTKEDKEALRQKELKSMKAKYGLQSNEFEEGKALRNPKYKDRAESRRQTVGSEGLFQQDDAPASVHVEISEVNKGRKMLEKMGWKKGEGLGKEGTGMKDPIQLKIRKAQSGLGACGVMSLDDASLTRSKSQKNWEKARERFADSCQGDTASSKTQCASPKAWIKAEPEAADSHAGVDSEIQS